MVRESQSICASSCCSSIGDTSEGSSGILAAAAAIYSSPNHVCLHPSPLRFVYNNNIRLT